MVGRGQLSFPIWFLAAALLSGVFFVPQAARAEAASQSGAYQIAEWQILWERPGEKLTIEQVSALPNKERWVRVHADGEYPALPSGIKSAWLKFRLPSEMTWARPAIFINKLYTRDISIYVQGKKIFEASRNYPFDRNKYLIPVTQDESNKTVLMKLGGSVDQIGLYDTIKVGDHQYLSNEYMRDGLFDIILGFALILLSIFLSLSVMFTIRALFSEWNSLSVVLFTIGVMLLSYSPFLHTNYPEYGAFIYYSFDIASSLFLPALFFFLEKILGGGPNGLIKTFRKIHTFSAFGYIGFMIAGFWFDTLNAFYLAFGPIMFALSILASFIVLVISFYQYCKQGNKEAIILSTGFSIFAGIVIAEMAWYFLHSRTYSFFYWKIGIMVVIACLVVVLVRKASYNYNQMMKYSHQLELFNNELQRSAKIEMISQLAASIAHEVRNPLQVTRGFLQLLRERSAQEKEKKFILLAIDELDRASEIITDFLTFAKPGVELHSRLNISHEILQIKAILLPLVTMQGAMMTVTVQEGLYVRGNSSKFKQAIINIIKNSIEALGENGQIKIQIKKSPDGNKVTLSIEDNGEGIEAEDLKHLGEPYYSKKSKGTGLGLMVTYRIIEAMNGKITYRSERGKGTQVSIVFPVVMENADAV